MQRTKTPQIRLMPHAWNRKFSAKRSLREQDQASKTASGELFNKSSGQSTLTQPQGKRPINSATPMDKMKKKQFTTILSKDYSDSFLPFSFSLSPFLASSAQTCLEGSRNNLRKLEGRYMYLVGDTFTIQKYVTRKAQIAIKFIFLGGEG